MEAMEISWDNIWVKSDYKFKYMYGVLKNLKLKRENPELAKIKEEENKKYF